MASGEDPLNFEEVYAVLGNPVKRRIVELLGERGPLPFSELRRALGVSVGALYYNLDGLKGFVEKDEARRYALTSRGQALYRAIKEGDEAIRRALTRVRGRYAELLDRYLVSLLVPQKLFIPLYGRTQLSALVTAACLAVGIAVSSLTRLPLKLLEVEPVPLLFPKNLLSLTLQPEALLALECVVSLALSTLVIAAASRLVLGARGGLVELAAGASVSQLPLYAYMVVQYALTGLGYPDAPYTTLIGLAVLQRLMQALTLGLLTASISVFCKTSRERGFLVAALLLYLSYFLKTLFP